MNFGNVECGKTAVGKIFFTNQSDVAALFQVKSSGEMILWHVGNFFCRCSAICGGHMNLVHFDLNHCVTYIMVTYIMPGWDTFLTKTNNLSSH